MAKKRANSPVEPIIEPDMVEIDDMVEEIEIDEIPTAEVEIEPIEVEVIEPIQEVKTQGKSDREKFIEAQLKVVNQMNNPAKQKRLAERILKKH